ncbi:hypothetical protein GHT07_18720 [Caenimonas koreensis DSM 17982]|uniref:Uncharacterized protein n=1 Tax=Caenimonas koreensis DSM 17982 TaxID=1121255 RepID=A0A844B829_9BURK|nr:hypothetical protein [Caenimonas koreensis]MRD49313.1 hypothetical protein [Caenimonas koreensis DSM 17982]
MEGLKDTEQLLTRLGRFEDAARVLEWRLQHESVSAQTIKDYQLLAIRWLQAQQFAKADAPLDIAVAMCAATSGDRERANRDAAIDKAATRLFLGNLAGAQEALAQADPGDATTAMVAAMISHSSGTAQTLDQELAALERLAGCSPVHLITLAAWHNAPGVALQVLGKYIGQEPPAAEPVSATEARSVIGALLSSPFILASPARAALEDSQAWQTLRERCGLVPGTEDIRVPFDVPDMRAHVAQVLQDMERQDLMPIAATLNPRVGGAFKSWAPFYPDRTAPAVHVGVQLEATGRQLLAAYFNRKYGCSITVLNTGDPMRVATELVGLIEQARSVRGDTRRALCFGDIHGASVVYIREGDEEAILLADSVPRVAAPPELHATHLPSALLKAITALPAPPEVYVQSQGLQSDSHSCFTFAMKAAVTLTRRTPEQFGEPREYLIAELIDELRRDFDPKVFSSSTPVRMLPVPSVPEIAKMFQGPADRQVGRAKPVRDSKGQPTVGNFITAHSAEIPVRRRLFQPRSAAPPTVHVADYTRQKGNAYAAIIDAESWNQAILAAAPAGRWNEDYQIEFTRELKQRIHAFTERAEGKHRARST